MIRKITFTRRYLTPIVVLFLLLLTYLHVRTAHEYTLCAKQWLAKNDYKNIFGSCNTQFTFVASESYWNFSLNSFLQLNVEADITADIHTFIQDNVHYLEKNNDLQIPIHEQAKHYGSMSAVGVKMKDSNNEVITLIFSRIWYAKAICYSECNPNQSYIYVEALTSNYQKVSHNLTLKNGKILRVPTILNITQPDFNGCCLGPEDPRIVLNENGELFFSFNMIDADKRSKIWLYDISTNYQASIFTRQNRFLEVEKNWSPFVKNNKLYFVYSYKPLKILYCPTGKSECEFIPTLQDKYQIGELRGGTQLVRFRDTDYFVGIARTKTSCSKCHRFYRPHLIVLSTASKRFHLVYVSEPLTLDTIPIFASYIMTKKNSSSDFCHDVIRIMTPGSIIDWEWSTDKLTFTISINDQRSFVISVTGIGKVLLGIIPSIENKYSHLFLNGNFDQKTAAYGEAAALNYCERLSEVNKIAFGKEKGNQQNLKQKVIKTVINSPTYPTFLVASNARSEAIRSWITNDIVNFGLVGRYLIEYESAYGNQPAGAHLMVDAGGNHATYALYSASLNQSVLVFEVLLHYWILIEESIRLNSNLSERITLYPFGVGDENRLWKIIPGEGQTRLEFIESKMLSTDNQKLSNDLATIRTYRLDEFIFQKISLMKIDVEGFEIGALKGVVRAIRTFGIGAILIEIAPNRWIWNNNTVNEGIFVLEQVTSIGYYLSYVIARNDNSCPASQISKLNGVVSTKNLWMINQQNGKYEVAPQIFRITEWMTIVVHMKNNGWSCNFWLEGPVKRATI